MTAIWDLRKGDADDDRMSPGGRGIRAIVLSALFEFNVVQAALAFTFLVLVPAFLIGLVPSILATYGALLRSSLERIWAEPLPALLLFAVLGVAAYLWGRRLYTATARNLWQLNYTLVFPIFVLVREAINVIGERWLGPEATIAEMMRKRRWGTVLAGALFAGVALLIAQTLLLTMGIVSVSLTSASPWPIIRAGLIDGLIVLSISTVVASVYWAWRELAVPTPVLGERTENVPARGPTLRVAHLSDLHLVGSRHDFRMEPRTRGPQGNERWRSAAGQVADIDQKTPLDWVLITGDVTDTGTRAEWVEFLHQVDAHPGLRDRMLILPGNHDINIADRWSAGRLEMPWSASMALRKLRFIVAADQIQGQRVHVVDHMTGKLGPTLHDLLRGGNRMEQLCTFARDGTFRGRFLVARLWRDIFPMVVPPGPEGRPGILLLNSCTDSHMALTNGIGTIEPRQLKALQLLMAGYGDAKWIVALHHQVTEYAAFAIPLKERFGLSLMNAADLLVSIGDCGPQVVVLHGHRHRDWIGTCGAIKLCSAPSATLGAHDAKYAQGLFHLHELDFNDSDAIAVARTETVVVSDS